MRNVKQVVVHVHCFVNRKDLTVFTIGITAVPFCFVFIQCVSQWIRSYEMVMAKVLGLYAFNCEIRPTFIVLIPDPGAHVRILLAKLNI